MFQKCIIFCLLFFIGITHYCSAQKRWDIDFSLIARRNFLYSRNNQEGLGPNYKFISPIKGHGEMECSYKLNTKVSLQLRIGLGVSGNGVKFVEQDGNVDITQQVSANLFYLKIIPLKVKYFLTNRLAFSLGTAIYFYTDDE